MTKELADLEKEKERDLTQEDSKDLRASSSTPDSVLIYPKCKVWAYKDDEYRKAEILSIRLFQNEQQYYVHYQDFNKRLDEWIPIARIDLSKGVECPTTETTAQKNGSKSSKSQKKSSSRSSTPQSSSSNAVVPQKRPLDGDASVSDDLGSNSIADDDSEQHELDKPYEQHHEPMSKEKEIEKLRTQGSMVQNPHEVARIRNLNKLSIGKFEVEPWYFSHYPEELTQVDTVYICEFCLLYFGSEFRFQRHRKKCTLKHPPGNEIYRDDELSFFEIDGRKQRTWCRCLCLLSKCFLDHKTLYYDVDLFLFYCMCTRDEYGYHLVGYFSKEKESSENYNVACILTLPQYQRHGYGKSLMQFSYELSKREGKLGSPEKPLSDLGLLSYRAYWAEQIIARIVNRTVEVTIDELANQTAMTTQDVLHTLQNLNVLKYYRGQHVIVITKAIEEQYKKMKQRKQRKIQSHLLDGWTPPNVHPSTLRYAW